MGLVKSLWVVGGENSSHRGEEWAKLYVYSRYDTSLRTHDYINACASHAKISGWGCRPAANSLRTQP